MTHCRFIFAHRVHVPFGFANASQRTFARQYRVFQKSFLSYFLLAAFCAGFLAALWACATAAARQYAGLQWRMIRDVLTVLPASLP